MNFDLIEQEALEFEEFLHIRVWTGLKRKEELHDERGIVFQYPDFAFLLSGSRRLANVNMLFLLIVSDSGTIV